MNHAPFSTSGLAAVVPVFAGIGQEGDVAGAFYLGGDGALVERTGAGLATWANFAFVSNISAQQVCILVVDDYVFVGAELADFGARVKVVVRSSSERTLVSHNLLQKFY
jgi:hypothetical protein